MKRVAVVTGASSGIGRALSERLAAEGWQAYAFSRASAHFEEAASTWADAAAPRAVVGDLRSAEDVSRLIEEVGSAHGRLDLLVNNAGAYFVGDGGLPAVEVLEANLEANLLGAYRMLVAAAPLLFAADHPVVVNVSSGAAGLAAAQGPGPLGYRVSKAALNMLSRSLAAEWRERNVAVHAVDPGWVRTRLNPAGSATPEEAAAGMWELLTLHDMSQSGQFWHAGQVLPW